ncbi:TRAP transporter substrate-binding protein [Candidatus Thalassolituus haligoni]|jgi:TRAP-type C4-dicarboxylate transport system substrate-binding protein|uniref:TRAP transporter substrate-binding protein n=1 Tax=Candidatus Thalassolituus haligoni TaxID=3100113 RepID=UPI00351765BF|tara:strand:- start:15199 stop:16221 length:1023 start_codon:yes stop_codon:yes gene_type:complete
MKKRHLKFITLLALMLSFNSASYAETTILRYSAWLPATYFMHKNALYKYFEDIEQVTEGRVKVEISAAPLGPAPRNFQLALSGIADITWGLHGYTPGTFPLSEMVELPFNSTNAVENSAAYWKVFKKYFEPAGMHKGVHTLTVHTQPPGQIFSSKQAITEASNFEGLKIRSTNSGVAESIALLGAVPLGIPVTEMRDALHKGIVDGVSLTDEALYSFNIDRLIKHKLEVPGGMYNASMFLVVNQNKWDQISAADQQAITSISGEVLARRMGQVWQDELNHAAAQLAADGIEKNVASGPLFEFIQSRLSKQDANWVKKANALNVDGQAALEMYHAESSRGQ